MSGRLPYPASYYRVLPRAAPAGPDPSSAYPALPYGLSNVAGLSGQVLSAPPWPLVLPCGGDDGASLSAALGIYGGVLLAPQVYTLDTPVVMPPWTSLIGFSNVVDNSALSDQGGYVLAPSASFSSPWSEPGPAAVTLLDQVTGGYDQLSAGQQVSGINIDCSSAPAGTHGIASVNQVYGVSVASVVVQKAPGTGLYAVYDGGTPDGWHVYHSMFARCGRGVDVNIADTIFDDCLAIGATTDHNWYIRNAVDSIFSNCRGGNAAIHNWYFAVNQTAAGGYCLLEGCASDLADSYGVLIDYGNTGGIWLNFMGFSSDSDNAGAATGAIRISSAPQPVIFDSLTVNTTADYGFQYANAANLVVASGILNGATAAFNNGGGNGTVLINTAAIIEL
jgi:hypothetical protein